MNPNMRMLWDNAADRGALATSSEAGRLTASNLRTNIKSRVWRGLSPSEGVFLSWDEPEPVSVVALAHTNFTSQATMRIRGFTQPGNLIPEFDIGPVLAAPPAGLGHFPFGLMPLESNFYRRGGASLFAYGYGSYGVVWIPGMRAVRKLEIIIDDPTNPDGYIEVGRLIVGPYWEPLHNFSFGHSVSFPENSNRERSQAGDLRTERGAMWKRIEFGLQYMDAEDKTAMLQIMRHHGVTQPLFVSLFPENEDKMLEQSYQVWGQLGDSARLQNPAYDTYATQIAIEET